MGEELLDRKLKERIRARPLLTVGFIVGSDILALTLSVVLALLLRSVFGPITSIESYLLIWPLILIVIGVFAGFGLYPGLGLSPANELRRLSSAISLVFIFLAGLTFIIRGGWIISRAVFILAWGLAIFLVPLARSLARSVGSRLDHWGIPVVIITSTEKGEEIASALMQNRKAGFRPVALLNNAEDMGEDVLHAPIEMAPILATKYGIQHAILAFPWVSSEEFSSIVDRYCFDYRHLLVVPSIMSDVHIWVTPIDIVGNLGLEVKQNLLSPSAQTLKRFFDLIVSLLLGIFLMPLFAVIAVALVVDSPGPVLYSQRRTGKGGKPFMMMKFRTMVPEAEQELQAHLEVDRLLRDEWERHQKLAKDPRITRLGRWLRRYSLDELPQLFNVVRGEMSLVGPRPMMTDQEAVYGDRLNLYRRVFPGMTGLWQISGRNVTSFTDRARFDSYYVRNWSIWLDFYILAKTPLVAIKGEGAF
jgi:Undecaprenyl-phosphate galactose phosphotransferase WbaP